MSRKIYEVGEKKEGKNPVGRGARGSEREKPPWKRRFVGIDLPLRFKTMSSEAD